MMNSNTASALPRPKSKNRNASAYMRDATTSVSKLPLVMTNTTSKTFSTRNKAAVASFEASLRRGDHPQTHRDAYWTITHLRNALAHGVRPRPHYQSMLKDPDRLDRELEAALKRLLG